MFLSARAPKSIRKSNLTLSAFFLVMNLPDPAWKLLQRLKIIVSKETIKQWVLLCRKKIEFDDFVLFYSLDNCDIHKHITHTCSGNKLTYIHLISHYVIKIAGHIDVMAADIWQGVN
jgi:hypothetical protein